MNDHSGYLFILFDMPTINKKDKKVYIKLIKELKSSGYIMALESTYYKYYDNLGNSSYDLNKLKVILNNVGSVFVMKYTIYDFEKIIYISGNNLLKLDKTVSIY